MDTDKEITRIAIFDDSEDALKRYREHLAKDTVEIWTSGRSVLDAVKRELVNFNPDLIITDLLIGDDREDGYRLIRDIGRVEELRGIPVVVCSKLINDSVAGQKERAKCCAFPNVKASFGKIPHLPELGVLMECLPKPKP